MSDWSHGYDVSVGYSYGFYREMAPDWLDLCASIGGFEPPQRVGRPFRYLELGSGQGFGLCVLAAANPRAEFIGVDFQPEHIEHSAGLAKAAGLSNVRFVQADFLDLAEDWPKDFGAFDYVAVHGTLSYLALPLREALVQCLSHATAPGGLVYVSYNAQPGCLSTVPLQHFSRRIKEDTNKQGAEAVEDTIALLEQLAAGNAPVFHALPLLKSRLEALKTRDKEYLVHEYLPETWNVFWHSDLARELGQANLDYVASATLADNLLREFLQPPQYRALAEQQDEGIRQDLESFIVNQAFRRDIFGRGAAPRASSASIENMRVYLAASLGASRSLNFETSFGLITWEPAVFASIVEACAAGPRSLGELFRLPNATIWKPRHILLLLLHATALAPQAAERGDVEAAQRFNAVVARAVCGGAPYRALAAATLGSGITVSDIDMMLLDLWLESSGGPDASTLAQGLSNRMVKLGRTLDDGMHANALAATFTERTIPLYRQLGVLK
jgi:SAM-dependent methyltransferase